MGVHKHLSFQRIFEHFQDGLCVIDTGMIIQYTNPMFCKLLGYAENNLNGTPITNYLDDLTLLNSCILSTTEYGHCYDQKTVFKKQNGSLIHFTKNVQALFDEAGNVEYIIVSIRDISYDFLTHLPNRTKLIHDLTKIEEPVALILLDIDNFKELNAYYGHDMADNLLVTLTQDLETFISVIPGVSLYKFPVDEFALLFQNSPTEEELIQHVVCIAYYVNNRSFMVADQEISISITIGATHSATKENNTIEHANLALKDAKKRRKNYQVYSLMVHPTEEDYKKNRSWIKRLRNAIIEKRVIALFQPIINSKTNAIEKYEALVRIVEDEVLISPVEFLDISKRVKMYHQITMIMLDNVLEALSKHDLISCSMNLSIEDIVDPQMSTYIIDKIKSSAFSNRIIFEILESEGIENYDTVNSFIDEVKQYGVKIAIDDFGAGYSNFIYITKLNIDFIKIDGSIIRNICTDNNSQIITKTIIDFAAELGIETIAEFVSSKHIYDYVNQLGIDYLQGYYVGEPSSTILQPSSL